jgi:hypothetical protein
MGDARSRLSHRNFGMAPRNPVWFQRLPTELRRRLDLAEAAAREDRFETHAEQALDLVSVLATRMPFDDAIEHYTEMMGLNADDAEVVRTRALVSLSESGRGEELARERYRSSWRLDWRYATPLGAVRFVRRHLRRSAEEDLWSELAAARAEEAIVHTHIRHALHFVELLDAHAPPPRCVSFYLDRLEVPSTRAYSVYQRALAEVAERLLPGLAAEEAGDVER